MQARFLTSRWALLALATCGLALPRAATPQSGSSSGQNVKIGATTVRFGGFRPRIDVLTSSVPRIGLTGASSMTLPTIESTQRVLRFGLELDGWDSTLAIGDDRDPIHGFKAMLTIDGTGNVLLSGAATSFQIVPGHRYEFELTWQWTSSGLVIEHVAIDDGNSVHLLTSGEYRAGNPGTEFEFQHLGTGTTWLDSISLLPQ